jgi:hypothetical protein
MRSMLVVTAMIAALHLLVAGGPPPASAADRTTPPESRAANDLVKQLASPSFRARERATTELTRLGLAANEALLEGLESPDAEVRSRCERVLEKVLEWDYRARLRAFADDKRGTSGHGLGGWERFSQLAGVDLVARQLFVQMHQAEAALMESGAAGPEEASRLLAFRCQELQDLLHANQFGRRGQVTLGNVAAVVFMASDPGLALVGEQHVNYMSRLIFQTPFQNAINDGDESVALKKIVGAWVGRTTGSASAFHALVLSLRYDLREGLSPALDMVAKGGVQPQILQYAILAIGKMGGREHLTILAPLLKDSSVCTTAQIKDQQIQVEVRDVALAVMVYLTGQDLKDYGMTRIDSNPQYLFNPGSIGFLEDSERERALNRWQAWHSAQPQSPAGP